MVVSFTTYLGLAKPDEFEIAKNWVANTKLQEDNNLLIEAGTNKTTTFYTPSLVAQTSNPNVGSVGSVLGEYQVLEDVVMGNFIVTFSGSGISAGTGEYGISLPFVVDPVFHTVGSSLDGTQGFNSIVGEGFCNDASAAATSGSLALDVVTIGGTSYVRMMTEAFTAPVKTIRLFSSGMPFTVATDDRLIGNFIYKRT